MDYSRRRIHRVEVRRLGIGGDPQGIPKVFGDVCLELTGAEGSLIGPVIKISLSTAAGDDPTIRDAQRALLAAALDLLNRGWKEDPSDLAEMAYSALSMPEPDDQGGEA